MRQIHNILTGSLDQAVRWGWRGNNPAKLATPPAVRQAEVRPPSPGDVVAAIALADLELATFLRLSAYVGGRRGEVSALRWTNVDLDAGELVIAKALVEKADRTIIEKDTKTHQAQRIALDAGTVAALRAWRAELEHRAEIARTVLRKDGFVFRSHRRRLGAVAALPLDQLVAAPAGEGWDRSDRPPPRPPPLRRHPASSTPASPSRPSAGASATPARPPP